MEFLVLTSQYLKQPERERIILQAVIELAEAVGIERIVMRRSNVYCTGVYVNNGDGKSLLYNDWEKDWDQKKIIKNMRASLQFSPDQEKNSQLILTIT